MTAEHILHKRISSNLTDRWPLPVKEAVLAAIDDAIDMGYKEGWEQAESVGVSAVRKSMVPRSEMDTAYEAGRREK